MLTVCSPLFCLFLGTGCAKKAPKIVYVDASPAIFPLRRKINRQISNLDITPPKKRRASATTLEHVQTHFERPGLDSRALLQAVVRLRRMSRRKDGSRIDEGVRDGVRLQEVQEGLPQGLSVPIPPLASKILQDFIWLDLIL
jgi:hypothetical protein